MPTALHSSRAKEHYDSSPDDYRRPGQPEERTGRTDPHRRLEEFGPNSVEEVAHEPLWLAFAKEFAHFFAIIGDSRFRSWCLQRGKVSVSFDSTPQEQRTSMNPPPLTIVTSGNDVAGYEIVQYLGIVRGIIVRSTGIGRGILGGLRSLAGGNIPEYVAVCEEARQHAYELMLSHAAEIGAEAIIAFRYDATEFMQGSTEVLAYGTAVKIKKCG